MSVDFKVNPDHRKVLDKKLEEFETLHSLNVKTVNQVPKYLDMQPEQVAKLTIDELTEASLALTQYAIHVQRVINKNKSWERWALSKLDDISGSVLPDIGTFYGFNERMLIAKTQPELCQRLNELIREVRMYNDRLYGMPDLICRMADNIKEIKFANLRREKNEHS